MKLKGKFDVGGIIAKEDERYKVVDNSLLRNLVLSSTSLNPGYSTSGHKHAGQEEVYLFIKGSGDMTLIHPDDREESFSVTEGDIVRVKFTNYGSHAHNIHFHGIHSAAMDGLPGIGEVEPGESFLYEFEALPFGCHLYHCHSMPLSRHVHKGLYGAFIIDPDPARNLEFADVARSRLLGSAENDHWQELLMVMNGFDVNFDEENEVYAVNSIAHAFSKEPIKIDRTRPVRVYLINITEFDPINSFHLHANFFQYFDHGTTLNPTSTTIDTVMQCQGQRGILEFTFADHEPGKYMFHAHQTEFAEQGWTGFFDVS